MCTDGKREAVINIRLSNLVRIVPVILSVVLGQGAASLAQGPEPAQVSGPVDIQANEQEFAGDQIIAKGNVRVVYKDSIIHAPMATLQRDAGGNPQKAIFTGHPHLVQGKSLIDADTLMFDIANSKVIAEGHAHSEVEQTEDTAKKDDKGGSAAGGEKKALVPIKPKGKGDQPAGAEKIVTDADHQEYDRSQDKFEATGHVKVIHGDIVVHSEKLQLVYGTDKKPETAIFTGQVVAKQGQNNTIADTITYSLTTRRLQATGHVKSKVVQPKKEDAPKKADSSQQGVDAVPQASLPADPGAAYAATTSDARKNPSAAGEDDPIVVTSNSQENSEETGRLSAEGNVKVYYQDMVGIGPKVIMVKNSEGRAEKVYFVGRSQVSQTGRRWIADRITIVVADKKVLAEGNTKAMIIQQSPGKSAPSFPAVGDSKLAGRPSAAPTSISARKIETPQ